MDMARSGDVGGSTEHPARVIPTTAPGVGYELELPAPDDLCRQSNVRSVDPFEEACQRPPKFATTAGLAISSEVVAGEGSPC